MRRFPSKQRSAAWTGLVAAAAFTWTLAFPASAAAQRAVPRGGSGQTSGGGGTTSAGGGRVASGGGERSGGGDRSSGGDRSGGQAGDRQTGSRTPRTPTADKAPSEGNVRRGAPTATAREPGNAGDSDNNQGGDGSQAVPPYSRPRGGNPVTGEAVARRGRPPSGGDGDSPIWVPGGYYGGGYYPWGYGGFGVGSYYGGYYDPWYSGGYQPYYRGYDYDGRLRLKVKPREAEVFVDGYFAGIVDEFDGFFQRLRIEPGPHRVEVREEGYEPLTFDVLIQRDRTITYTAELKPQTP
jgi:hypothetical protein